ncbi:adenylosuccinate synthase [Williamsoniiplasma luminosum]|uniref:Adenylosuccinate synthetase n=1 Tax=Williamsoniiplasma luminosum TaxID=214888 RepID=A0A2S0NKR4_9MOLU|nr:adenylosuccinate synthase [Williamsoniiplasma luminosum]AVP49599.1 MAG: adenylosuccinate synthase [Williamsoniiplasma luminosum]
MKRDFKTLVVIGTQWGDEGKGKITDYFAQKAEMVVRFAGGDNAGHMIEFGGVRYKVTIVPSGIFNPKVKNIIGNGTVVNLEKLVSELAGLNQAGIDTSNLFISGRAHLILPFNLKIDELQEEFRKENKIGTTKRGIGPTYADKIARMGIRVHDVLQPNFKDILKESVDAHNKILKNLYESDIQFTFDEIYNNLMTNFDVIKNNILDTGELVADTIEQQKFVLFEGAQGILLDIDHGTYPFVTSSNTSANNASLGSGVHYKHIQKVVGVAKAYNTRVGTGGMPTELFDETGNRIRERGREYGSNTGRPRRVGWFDAVAMKYAIRVGGIDELFLTLFDVLDHEENLKICIAYELDGKQITSMPTSDQEFRRCKPIYVEVPGWKEDITKVRSYDELPENAKNYMNKIAEYSGAEFLGFSVGPDRAQTILLKGEFDD